MSNDQTLDTQTILAMEATKRVVLDHLRKRVLDSRFEVTSRFLLLLLEDNKAQQEFVDLVISGKQPELTERMKELLLEAGRQAEDDLKPANRIMEQRKRSSNGLVNTAIASATLSFLTLNVAFSPGLFKTPAPEKQTDTSVWDQMKPEHKVLVVVSALSLLTAIITGGAAFLKKRELEELEKTLPEEIKTNLDEKRIIPLIDEYISKVEPELKRELYSLQAEEKKKQSKARS
jgi:hypothetical protein